MMVGMWFMRRNSKVISNFSNGYGSWFVDVFFEFMGGIFSIGDEEVGDVLILELLMIDGVFLLM